MKKRVLSLALALLMLLSLVPMSALAAESSTQQDISVGTAAELAALGDKDIEGNITLTADLDMSSTAMQPIKSLKGCFNGNGKTISNLTLTGGQGSFSERVNTGLIGELNGSVINVKMTGITIGGIDQYNNVGALVGKIADGSESTIDNCVVSGTITGTKGNGNTMLGGLVGFMTGSTDQHTALTINNCVSNVAVTGASSTYVGGLLGSAQYYSDVKIQKCAELGKLSGQCTSAGMIGYINSSSSTLSLSDTYLGGKVTGSKEYGIAYNTSALSSLTCTNFYYDSEKNPSPSSWSSFDMLKSGNSAIKATAKTTAEMKTIQIEGFAVSADFDGYPIPVWTMASAPKPSAPAFSCTLRFTGTEGGTLVVKHGKTTLPANEDGSYTLAEAGDYTYSVTFAEDSCYHDVEETAFTVGEQETEKSISVTLTYRATEPTGAGTEEDPILISTAAELRGLANKVNDGELADAYVKLENDITVPGSWTPLGKNAVSPFRGHFDGDGHSVTVTVDDPDLQYFGFFGCLEDAVVENLTVKGSVYCSEPYAFVGGLAARARGNVVLTNCGNEASVSALARGSAGVGGLVGGYDDNVDYQWKNVRMTVNGCTNSGTIQVTGSNTEAMVGGLVGSNANCVQISNSRNTAAIHAPGCTVGGLLGQAGYQTGDFVPSITDSANTGTLIGAEGKTNNLYGKGSLRASSVTGSGDNTYTGGSASEDDLLAESQKYYDVAAVPATAAVGDEITLRKAGESAGEGITVTYSLGERDIHKDYLKITEGKLVLAKQNETGKVIEATATITWRKDGQTLSKPITVNIYPASTARQSLMNAIAESYTSSSSDWVVFDMAVYGKLSGTTVRTSDAARKNYLNLTTNELAGTSPLVTDRAKAEIILAALGVDSTKLTPYDGETASTTSYSNAEKLAAMNLGSSHYAAPWVLLAEQAGKVKLTDSQCSSMIKLLTDSQNLGENGLFFTKWGGETYADPDTTGTALAALAAYQSDASVKAFLDKAVAGLSQAQGSNGSFGNVNSDAMVITGLTAVGIDPAADPRFVKGGCSLADALLLYVNDAKNGFTTTYSSGTQGEKAQALATEQGFRALVTLEQFGALNGSTKSYNVYTQTAKVSTGGSTTVTTPDKPDNGYVSTDKGTVDAPSGSGSTGGSTGGTTTSWLSATVTIRPDSGTIWYAGSVRVKEGATVEEALQQAAGNAGMTLDIQDHYLRAVTYQGKTLEQFDKGPNSGWLYQVNGKAPNAGIDEYTLSRSGETITLYYTEDYTKEADLDISKPSGGGSGGGATTIPTTPAEPVTCPFTDIQTHWARDAVVTAWSKQWIKGVSETTFAPEQQMTRAMLVTVLYRLDGEPTVGSVERSAFHDVPSDAYYAKAVAWAAENGIVKGLSEEEFAPDAAITREQLAAILYRYAAYKKLDTTQGGMALREFDDAAAITSYAVSAMEWAVNAGILKGVGNARLAPQGTATRAQVATMLVRFDGLNTK